MTAITIATVGLAMVVFLVRPHGAPPPTAANVFAGGQIDLPARDFALRDQDGHRASLSQYRGQVVILTFMYSTCRDTCPVEADQIRGALDVLGRRLPTLAVSVDPGQDSPLNAQRFLLKQSLTGRMRFLLGTRAQLTPIWRAYGVAPESGATARVSNHSAYVMLVDRRGRLRIGFPDSQLTPEGLAHDVRLLLSGPA